MRLTKHVHACVEIDHGEGHLLIDPGSFTTGVHDLIGATNVILITHQHGDHVDSEAVTAALAARPELRVYGPAPVVEPWLTRYADQVKAVAPAPSA